MGSAVGVSVIPLTGCFQRCLRIRSLVPDTVLGALLCPGWAEDSLAEGYLVAQHEAGFFETLWRERGRKEGNLSCLFPNPCLIRWIRQIVSAAAL